MRWRDGILMATIAVSLSLPLSVAAAQAQVGQPAPDFTVTDTTGRSWSLGALHGKFVVLEWFNHDCPFTRKHYESGNMQRLQRTYTAKGVVWLSVNSSAPGKQGHLVPEEANALTQSKGASPTAIVLDPEGMLGKRYGAKATPHLFIISSEGVVIYAGAVDDTPSASPVDVKTATNYVERALDEAMAGKPVSTPQTQPYGCSVKY